MTAPNRRVLVTGAEEHQGLAVIRGLGVAGIEVVACGTSNGCLGHRSRYATLRRTYRAASDDHDGFVDDILRIAEETQPALIMPSVETTLVALNNARARIERIAPIAAPPPETLEFALDKWRTMKLARAVGVPAPRTVSAATASALLAAAEDLTFPVAVKPRGNPLHPATANDIPFKSRYARDVEELERIVVPLGSDAGALLVQEFAPGVGHCVAAVCRYGEPLTLFAYARDREYPLTGGVSVLRRSLPMDTRLSEYTRALLGAIRWHGVAMVEFKYDASTDRYTLMEINGRFQASTALSLDAGLNLPFLAACVFTGWTPPVTSAYRVGVAERWLRGDLLALRAAVPRTREVTRNFFASFRRDVHLDEFRRDDPLPALVEIRALLWLLVRWATASAMTLLAAPFRTPATTPRRVGSRTHFPRQWHRGSRGRVSGPAPTVLRG